MEIEFETFMCSADRTVSVHQVDECLNIEPEINVDSTQNHLLPY